MTFLVNAIFSAVGTFLDKLDTHGRYFLVELLGHKLSTPFQALSSLIEQQVFLGACGHVLLLHLLPIKHTWLTPTAGLCTDLCVDYQGVGHGAV